jgi:hypothetical protein
VDIKALQDNMEVQAQVDMPELQVPQEQVDTKEQLAHKAHKAHKGHKVVQEQVDIKALQD